MKLLIEYEINYSDLKLLNIKDIEEYYNRYFNKNGILYDNEYEVIYYEIDVPFIPIEGQRVGTKFGTCIVKYSYLELDEINDEYYGKSRIIVTEE